MRENGKIVYPEPFAYECCFINGYKKRLTEYAQELEEVIEELQEELKNKSIINEKEIALQIREMLIENAKEIARLEHDLKTAELKNEVIMRENELLTSQIAALEAEALGLKEQEREENGRYRAEVNKATKSAIASLLTDKNVPEEKIATLLKINVSSVRQYTNYYKKNMNDHLFQEKIDTRVLDWFRTGRKPA